MAHSNLPAFPSETFPQLEALSAAHDILISAARQCAGYAADKPYLTVKHAQAYISKQADELLAPIFTEEKG